MINHQVANKIETSRELNEYFLENLEIGDVIRGRGGFEFRIIAIHDKSYWCQHNDEIPITMSVYDMDSIKDKS